MRAGSGSKKHDYQHDNLVLKNISVPATVGCKMHKFVSEVHHIIIRKQPTPEIPNDVSGMLHNAFMILALLYVTVP